MSKPNVFISYAREDQGTAEKLYNDLIKAGFDCWIDIKNLLGGQDWDLEINKAIKKQTHFIALLSSHSVSKKGYIQKELKIGLDELEKYPPGEIFIIPVRLDNCTPVYEKLKKLHRIDMFPSYKSGLKEIFRVLSMTASSEKQYLKKIQSGDKFAAENDFEEAIAAYGSGIEMIRVLLRKDYTNKALRKELYNCKKKAIELYKAHGDLYEALSMEWKNILLDAGVSTVEYTLLMFEGLRKKIVGNLGPADIKPPEYNMIFVPREFPEAGGEAEFLDPDSDSDDEYQLKDYAVDNDFDILAFYMDGEGVIIGEMENPAKIDKIRPDKLATPERTTIAYIAVGPADELNEVKQLFGKDGPLNIDGGNIYWAVYGPGK